MRPPNLTPDDWNAIRDALEMRIRETLELSRRLKASEPELAADFEGVAYRADRTYGKLEELNVI